MSEFLDYAGLERFYGKSRLENVQGVTFQLLLFANNWTDNQQIATSDVLKSDNKYNYLVSFSINSQDIYSKYMIYMDDVTTDGSVTFHCKTPPDEEVYVNLLRLEVH